MRPLCSTTSLRAPASRLATSSRAAVVGLVLLAAAAHAGAQTAATPRRWEFRVSSGAFVPAGDQRDALKDAQVSAAQLSWLVLPKLAITGTVGWARSRDLSMAARPKLDVFSADLGVEARPAVWFAERKVTLSPLIGAGVGDRSYNHRSLDVDATHNVAAYGTAGGELGMGRVGLRLEVRDYASAFKPLAGAGPADTRNDVMMLVGVRFNRNHANPR